MIKSVKNKILNNAMLAYPRFWKPFKHCFFTYNIIVTTLYVVTYQPYMKHDNISTKQRRQCWIIKNKQECNSKLDKVSETLFGILIINNNGTIKMESAIRAQKKRAPFCKDLGINDQFWKLVMWFKLDVLIQCKHQIDILGKQFSI